MADGPATVGMLADQYFRALTANSPYPAVRRPEVPTPTNVLPPPRSEPAVVAPRPAVAEPATPRPTRTDEVAPPRLARTEPASEPVDKRPSPSIRLSAASTRGRILIALAGYGRAGVHAQALAVGLWASDGERSRAMWGYSKFPEHCNCANVVAKLSELRAAGMVHLELGSIYRVTQAGHRAAARLRAEGVARVTEADVEPMEEEHA